MVEKHQEDSEGPGAGLISANAVLRGFEQCNLSVSGDPSGN